MTHRRKTPGFTLVELLVVIAIIGILVALLMPAVQSARESARRLQCKNHITQLSKGALMYNTTHGRLPPGGWGYRCIGVPGRFGKEQPGSWIYSILPHIEQQPLYDSADTTAGRTAMIATPLAILHCPSRRRAAVYPSGKTKHRPHATYVDNPSEILFTARNDYAFNGGGPEHLSGSGPSDIDASVSFSDKKGVTAQAGSIDCALIHDGLSSTYLLGEKNVQPEFYLTSFSASGQGDYGDNENPYVGIDRDVVRYSDRPGQDRVGDSTRTYAFGSAHSDTFQMAFCDGSVRSISYNIEHEVHANLCNRDDGNTVSSDSY